MSAASLLALLHIGDSGFPTGGFAHSHGLEQAMRDGFVRDADALEAFVRSVLTQAVAPSEAVAAYAAALHAADGDIERVVAVDRTLLRSKAASELRAASLQTGRRLVEEVVQHTEAPILLSFGARLATHAGLGCYPIAFAVAGIALGAEPEEIPAALMLASATAVLQASMRLGRFSHRDAQGILHRLRPLVVKLSAEVVAGGPSQSLRAFHPMQEIASMRHERADARLFAS